MQYVAIILNDHPVPTYMFTGSESMNSDTVAAHPFMWDYIGTHHHPTLPDLIISHQSKQSHHELTMLH